MLIKGIDPAKFEKIRLQVWGRHVAKNYEASSTRKLTKKEAEESGRFEIKVHDFFSLKKFFHQQILPLNRGWLQVWRTFH